MRNKILASMLLTATLSFAQYGDGSYGSYGGSVWDKPSPKQDNTSAEENTQSDNGQYQISQDNSSQYTTRQYNVQEYSSSNKKALDKAERYEHTHRGFYFSNTITFGYLYLRHFRSEYDSYDRETEENHYKFKGFMTPYYEMRLGASIANRVSIFGGFGCGIGTGNLEHIKTKTSSSENTYIPSKVDATNVRLVFVFGGEFYPIQDKENPAYGLFVGLTGGIAIDGAMYDKVEYHTSYYSGNYTETYSTTEGFINPFIRFEVGKDWWISRRWSVGVAFNYTLGGMSDDDDKDRYYYSYYDEKESFALHSFGLTLRLTH